MPGVTTTRLAELFSLEGLIVRADLQQDKKTALLAVANMFDDFQIPYVVVGGIALQLYTTHVRATIDVDIVSLRKPFEQMKTDQPWADYGFELVFDRRRFIKLRHASSNVEVDINVDTRFASLMDEAVTQYVEGQAIPFCSPKNLAFTKLRTQRSDWPRDPVKRRQDRVDLMAILRAHAEITETLRAHPLTTDEMQHVLDEVGQELSGPSSDDLPPDDESDIPA